MTASAAEGRAAKVAKVATVRGRARVLKCGRCLVPSLLPHDDCAGGTVFADSPRRRLVACKASSDLLASWREPRLRGAWRRRAARRWRSNLWLNEKRVSVLSHEDGGGE